MVDEMCQPEEIEFGKITQLQFSAIEQPKNSLFLHYSLEPKEDIITVQ